MTTDEIRAMLAAATPGPWCLGEDGQGNLYIGSLIAGAPEKVAGFFRIPADHETLSAEARLIISAPTIAALAITQAEEIERLRKALISVYDCLDNGLDKMAYNIASATLKEPKT